MISHSEYNIKSREVYCKYCKITIKSNEPAPKCNQCNHEMVTLVYNPDGKLVTNVMK